MHAGIWNSPVVHAGIWKTIFYTFLQCIIQRWFVQYSSAGWFGRPCQLGWHGYPRPTPQIRSWSWSRGLGSQMKLPPESQNRKMSQGHGIGHHLADCQQCLGLYHQYNIQYILFVLYNSIQIYTDYTLYISSHCILVRLPCQEAPQPAEPQSRPITSDVVGSVVHLCEGAFVHLCIFWVGILDAEVDMFVFNEKPGTCFSQISGDITQLNDIGKSCFVTRSLEQHYVLFMLLAP